MSNEITEPIWRKNKVDTINPKRKIKVSVPTQFFIVVLFLFFVITFLAVIRDLTLKSTVKTIGDSTPYMVSVTEVSKNSFKINWRTKKQTIGFIKYGLQENALDYIGQSSDTSVLRTTSHEVKIEGLEAGQVYFFEIHSNAESFGLNGEAVKVKTLD